MIETSECALANRQMEGMASSRKLDFNIDTGSVRTRAASRRAWRPEPSDFMKKGPLHFCATCSQLVFTTRFYRIRTSNQDKERGSGGGGAWALQLPRKQDPQLRSSHSKPLFWVWTHSLDQTWISFCPCSTKMPCGKMLFAGSELTAPLSGASVFDRRSPRLKLPQRSQHQVNPMRRSRPLKFKLRHSSSMGAPCFKLLP